MALSSSDGSSPNTNIPPMEGQNRHWIEEKHCALCEVPLGHGTHREKKLYCQYCSHAICMRCSDPSQKSLSGRKSACKVCAGLEERKPEKRVEVPRLRLEELAHDPEFLASGPTEVLPHFDSLSDIPEVHYTEETHVLATVLMSAKQLIDSMAAHSRPESDPVAQSVQKYNQQLKNRHAEIALLKEQTKWYAQQLTKRDAEITELTYTLAVLNNVNFDLRDKVKSLEQRLLPGKPKPTHDHAFCVCGDPCHIL